MADAIKTLWRRWEVRLAVLAFSFGFAPVALLSLAVSAIQDKG